MSMILESTIPARRMTPEEYAEKYPLYRKSKVRRALYAWSAAEERMRKLERLLAAAKEKAERLWVELRAVEAANPEEVALSREISAEHSARCADVKLQLAA